MTKFWMYSLLQINGLILNSYNPDEGNKLLPNRSFFDMQY